ncbi:MAG: glutathione peroxidase [Rhodocyclaceae bacterium]|nr:glutathione peroxidase [Rhodocyclaceae bacterium]
MTQSTGKAGVAPGRREGLALRGLWLAACLFAGGVCPAWAVGAAAVPAAPAPAGAAPAPCPALLDVTFPELVGGKPVSLCQYRGKVLMVVNTASECGFTPQYEQLEALHRRLAPRGLVIVGFPSNDFGQQERGSNKAIADFCKLNYGVSFPMFERTEVVGPRANPFYAQLARRSGTAPGWNFHKYVVDRGGNRVQSFATTIRPDDPRLVRELERLLAEPYRPGA